MTLVQTEPKAIKIGTTEVKKVYVWRDDSRLPSEYQEVEYIQSSGTQYIDTGYILTSNPGFDIDFAFLGGDSNSWVPLCGARNNPANPYGTSGFCCLYVNSNSKYVTPNYAGFDPGTSSGLTINTDVKYNMVQDAGQFYVDGVYKSSCSTTNTYTSVFGRNFLLFANNNTDGTVQIRNCQMKLFGFKLYNNGTLVRDFVPCYRKLDTEIGLYDLVTNTFYTNQGTGTFTKGNDVGGLQEIQVRPKETVQTFDFQNDGSLNWTAVTGSYGTPDFVTGKGWRIYRSNTNSQSNILPPSSAFTGTLKGIRMRIYKGFVNHGTSAVAYGVGAGVVCGNNRFIWSFFGANINYDRINYRANVSSDSYITTIDYSGEAKLELNLEGTTPILYINDENAYTLTGSVSSGYKDYWTNGTLAITIGSWRGGSDDIYIRKIQFITE